jgi:hypothetical protein
MRGALLALLALAALLAGCGDDEKASSSATPTKSEYEERFKQIVAESENSKRLSAPPDASYEEQADVLEEGLSRLREMTRELDDLEPPSDVRRAHDLYVSALGDVADDVGRVEATLRSGDEAEVRQLVDAGPGQAFARPETVRKLTEAREEFDSKGYDLGEVSQVP